MISIENVSKSFSRQLLFDEISFKLNSRERVGLVGRNGHGKTTLFKMLIGEEMPDSGSIVIPKHYRIGHVRQTLIFTEDNILKEAMKGLPEHESDHFWKAEKILAGLGFTVNDMQRAPSEFSGGFQVRLNLAKELLSEPDLLLLDEPTNYLDITSIRWIEKFLYNWPRELMLITHDRGFMDKIVTHTLAIHRGKLRKIEGNTEKLYSQIAQDEEIYEKTRLNDERKRKDIELFISRFRAKARLANMVQSRIKTLQKLGTKDKLEHIKDLDFVFRYQPLKSKYILNAQDITFGYEPDNPIIKNFNLNVRAGECIAVIGQNGKGKTTLLKLLAGTLKPQKGKITLSPGVEKGVFEQTNVSSLVNSRTVEDEIMCSNEDVDRQKARNICGLMMFEGDYALKKVQVLSGGEKSRVMLGKLLVTPVNILLLDEPTNHLDMQSCDALLEALDDFDGALIIVTHNEMLLHAVAERLVVFQDTSVTVFDGSYQNFLESGGWLNETINEKPSKNDKPSKNNTSNNTDTKNPDKVDQKNNGDKKNNKNGDKLDKQKRIALFAERNKILKPIEKNIRQIEQDIEKYEQTIKKLSLEMQQASQLNKGSQIVKLSQSIHQNQTDLDKAFTMLEKAHAEYEKQKTFFDK